MRHPNVRQFAALAEFVDRGAAHPERVGHLRRHRAVPLTAWRRSNFCAVAAPALLKSPRGAHLHRVQRSPERCPVRNAARSAGAIRMALEIRTCGSSPRSHSA